MKFYYILCLSVLAIFTSCQPNSSEGNVNEEGETKEAIKTTYLREPVEIIPSTGEDYPASMIELGFPVLPSTEVTLVGNTEIENGTVVMQLETLNSIDQIKAFYDKEMVDKGWEIKDLNIFQGADAAYSYSNQDYSTRILIINDKIQDFRKLAITLNKKLNPADHE